MSFVAASRTLMAAGSFAIGAWGLVHPRSLTALLGDDPRLGRLLGARDIFVGATLVADRRPWPVALRVASDLHDAVRLRQRSPLTACGAAMFAVWGIALFATSIRTQARVMWRHG